MDLISRAIGTYISVQFTSFFVTPSSTFRSNTMEGHPVILSPEDTILPMVTLGGAGGIHQDSNTPKQVIKASLKHNVQGCTQEVIEMVESTEEFSNLCPGGVLRPG